MCTNAKEIYRGEIVLNCGYLTLIRKLNIEVQNTLTKYMLSVIVEANIICNCIGQIVGVIVHNGVSSPESRKLLNVMVTSHPSPRWLEETELSPNSTAVAEVIFVRRAVAWTTGLMIIIATILGVSFSSSTTTLGLSFCFIMSLK